MAKLMIPYGHPADPAALEDYCASRSSAAPWLADLRGIGRAPGTHTGRTDSTGCVAPELDVTLCDSPGSWRTRA